MVLPSLTSFRRPAGKRVLVRIDANVPLTGGARTQVADDWRLRRSVPTLEYLLSRGARVTVMAHAGRPGGRKVPALSLKPVSAHLAKLLRRPVRWLSSVANTPAAQKDGTVFFWENLRFYKGEEANSAVFARKLARGFDAYVNDAFADSHRAHASVSAAAGGLPHYAGLLMEEEVQALRRVLHAPRRPLVVVLGGAKASGKLNALRGLMATADTVLIGGLVFVAYLVARGLLKNRYAFDRVTLRAAERLCSKRVVARPLDVVAGDLAGQDVRALAVGRGLEHALGNDTIVDIGPQTILAFGEHLAGAGTILWSGAMGRFEQHPYEYGTYAIARQMGAAALRGAFAVAGGGETIQALANVGVRDKLSHASTGGGAMLAFLAGEPMPGIDALLKKQPRM